MRYLVTGMAVILCAAASADAVVIASFENSPEGWAIPASSGNSTNFEIASYSNTTGVTEGAYSMVVGPTAANTASGPTYGQMLVSPSTTTNTALLGAASSVSFDVYAPPASFGYYLQFDVDVDNTDVGYQSLVNYAYVGTSIGAQATLTFPMPATLAAALAASANPTQIIIQTGGGYSAGNETFYIDNVRINAPVPEPVSAMSLAASMLMFRRRRVD